MESDTVSLRSSAPCWSLEGDSQLLSVLQNLHQKIITKCKETNTQLDAMVSALDNASIDLQNVNNKFMALSNSQFVESRVYEDELDLTDNIDNNKQASPKPENHSSLSSLKLGLQVLESLHEVVAIVASDSEDEEQSPRRVLRPRVCSRLPHVVGSQAWRDAAHAGLSSGSSDDSTDEGDPAPDQYSDSDGDQRSASLSLSSMTSHAPPPPVTSHAPPPPVTSHAPPPPVTSHAPPPPVTSHAPPPPVTSHAPSTRDARMEEQIPEPELEESPQPRKLYTVEKHIPAQIFSDEPPPLDRFEDDSDDDIFAELHKQSYPCSSKGHNIAEDLFGSGSYERRNKDDNDIGKIVTNTVAKETSPLLSMPLEPELKETPIRESYTESGVKKPVGGISLFGSKGSESIGAAILKRNQIQSPSESDTQTSKPNIIEDLFTKPVKNVQKEPSKNKMTPVVKEVVRDKVLFSDNIFDDIEDIFTSDVLTKTNNNKDKTLFDDNLFEADDNDNDIFNEENKDNEKPLYQISKDTKGKVKSIFESDSEDDLFSDVKLKDTHLKTNITEYTNDKNLNNENVSKPNDRIKSSELEESKTVIKDDRFNHQLSPNIFDDNDNDDDLFSDKTQTIEKSYSKPEIAVNISDDQNCEEKHDDINIEITRNSEVKITESETGVLLMDSEEIKEKHVDDTISIDLPSDKVNSETLINKSKIDKDDLEKLHVDTKDTDVKVTAVISNIKALGLPNIDFLEETKTPEVENTARDVPEINHSKHMFADVFDNLPPAFKKPIESKKSKNVNALFDDDSDDEALFFKKDDVITDEKPDFEFKSDRFQIFQDEPPDFDIDFSQKSRNQNQIPNKLDIPVQEKMDKGNVDHNIKEEHSLIEDENPTVSNVLTKNVQSEDKPNLDNVNSEDTITYEQTSKTDILKLLESERNTEVLEVNEDTEGDIFSDPVKSSSNEEICNAEIKFDKNKDDTDSSGSEKKLVGRLGPVTININVSSLLPGAVPRKYKNNEEIDGQTASKNNEEYNPDVIEPQTAKTVSFKETKESEVLDNKFSKERAKIQVKRRPSTRRARLEAVRKSGLDFGSDSTDNSSSFDEPVPTKNKMSVPYRKLNDETKLNSKENENNDKEVTSKVVYILNDEDIFKPRVEREPAGDADDAGGMLKPTASKGNAKENLTNPSVKENKRPSLTLDAVSGKRIKNVDRTRKSLFDDLSDDDTALFKRPLQKSLFDSDSESELFSGKKDKVKTKNVSTVEQKKPKETKTGSKAEKKAPATVALFGDDSDEDLFCDKTHTSGSKERSEPTPNSTRSSQSFEDPLSLLRDET